MTVGQRRGLGAVGGGSPPLCARSGHPLGHGHGWRPARARLLGHPPGGLALGGQSRRRPAGGPDLRARQHEPGDGRPRRIGGALAPAPQGGGPRPERGSPTEETSLSAAAPQPARRPGRLAASRGLRPSRAAPPGPQLGAASTTARPRRWAWGRACRSPGRPPGPALRGCRHPAAAGCRSSPNTTRVVTLSPSMVALASPMSQRVRRPSASTRPTWAGGPHAELVQQLGWDHRVGGAGVDHRLDLQCVPPVGAFEPDLAVERSHALYLRPVAAA